jgi:hypothetical protein
MCADATFFDAQLLPLLGRRRSASRMAGRRWPRGFAEDPSACAGRSACASRSARAHTTSAQNLSQVALLGPETTSDDGLVGDYARRRPAAAAFGVAATSAALLQRRGAWKSCCTSTILSSRGPVAEPPAPCRTFGAAANKLSGARRLRYWGGGPRTVYLFPQRCPHLRRRGWRCQQRRCGKRQRSYLRCSAATCEPDGHLANLSAGRPAGRLWPLGRMPATHRGHPADLQTYLISVVKLPALCRTFGTAANKLSGARRLDTGAAGPGRSTPSPGDVRIYRDGAGGANNDGGVSGSGATCAAAPPPATPTAIWPTSRQGDRLGVYGHPAACHHSRSSRGAC